MCERNLLFLSLILPSRNILNHFLNPNLFLKSNLSRNNQPLKQEAVKYYRLAAEQGDADGACYLGHRLKNGEGVEQDQKEAVNNNNNQPRTRRKTELRPYPHSQCKQHDNTSKHTNTRTQTHTTNTHAHTRVPIYTHVTRRNLECWRFLVPRSCGSHKLQNNNTNNNNESGNGEGGWGAGHAPALGCPKTRGRRGADSEAEGPCEIKRAGCPTLKQK